MPDVQAAWHQALEILSPEIPGHGLSQWLRAARPVALHDDVLLLAVPNRFARSYIQERMTDQLRTVLSVCLERDVRLEFVVPPDSEPVESEDPPPEETRGVPEPSHALNPRYTFDTFVVGSGNRLAHAASLAVAEAPGRAYNPFFIYGGVGLGKTHLMQAIAHHVMARNHGARVVYVSSEKFTNELISAIREGRQHEFRHRYRDVDVLLIDDVEFIAGKETTQEEFFHTFNTLHESRRQIVLSSDRPPKDIPTIEERLRSRFEWGLISDIQPPDLETRIAILQKKAQMESLAVPDEILHYIAERIPTNIRELEGALVRIVAYCAFHQRPLLLSVAEDALRDFLPRLPQRQVSIRRIQEVVAEHFGLTVHDLKARNRSRNLVYPRHVAMYLTRLLTNSSLPAIGHEFGGRDHTTVLHACEKMAAALDQDPQVAATVNLLKKRLLG